MTDEEYDAQDVSFPEVEVPVNNGESAHLHLDDLHRVSLQLSAVLGSTEMQVRDILELKVGSIVSLDKMAGEMTDIHLADQHIARGEVVVIGDSLHVRLSEILGLGDVQIR